MNDIADNGFRPNGNDPPDGGFRSILKALAIGIVASVIGGAILAAAFRLI